MVYVVLYIKRSDVIDQSIVLEVIVVEFARPTRELWPVMLTPFTSSGDVDYDALARMVDWYEENGSTGLFAICQSSEVFYLSLQERVRIAAFLKKRAHVPVIASGHVSYALEDQIDELRRVSDTGVDAVILITNRLAEEHAAPEVWMDHLHQVTDALDPAMPLGFYECPYPYKRLLSLDELRQVAADPRYRFLKDTCCDLSLIQKRLQVLAGSSLGLYNANTATLLSSLRAGAAGFSGVMANFHPELYAWLLRHFEAQPEKADTLQSILTMASLIEMHHYPVCAKYAMQRAGVPIDLYSRTRNHHELTPLVCDEVDQLARLTAYVKDTLLRD